MAAIIRNYRPEDWPSLQDIILNAENFGPEFLQHEKLRIHVFNQNPEFGIVLVAEDPVSHDIVGFMAVQYGWRALVIESIVVHHRYLRKGVGRELVEHIKKLGAEHPNADVLRVDTGDFMDYAQRFYESCGFKVGGLVSHYLSWHNDQIIYVLRLKE
jgi:ribosomal protein S18 acetylase RimI-like enzyme